MILYRSQSRAFLLDVTIPHRVEVETEKYRSVDLVHEITDMWDVASTEIILVVLSANRLIPASLANNLRWLDFCSKSLPAQTQITVRIVNRFLNLIPKCVIAGEYCHSIKKIFHGKAERLK